MREHLAPLVWRRHRFVATVGKRGRGRAGERTVCLYDLACEATGAALAQHVWGSLPGEATLDGVRFGDRVAFRATVRPYTRGDGSADFNLCKLRGVAVIERGRGDDALSLDAGHDAAAAGA
jgi:hypothetical protein